MDKLNWHIQDVYIMCLTCDRDNKYYSILGEEMIWFSRIYREKP